MLRFIVYRYISYKDSKISHASVLALRHHLPQLPPALLPTSQLHDLPLPYSTQLYYTPHCLTTSTCPTPPSPTTCIYPTPPSSTIHLTALPPAPALLATSLPHDLHLPYSTQLYYPPHCLSTCTRPTPLLGYLSHIRLPYLCAHCTHIYYCDLTGYTYYPSHRTHVPHSTPPSPSPPQMYHATYIL